MRSKIKETRYPKTDAKGSSCLVVMEDNTDGFFNYKGAFPFAIGEEVEYTATKTEKKTKPGEFYNVMKIDKIGGSQPSSSSPSGQPPSLHPPSVNTDVNAHKVNACVNAMHDAVSAFNAERIPWEKVTESQRELAAQLCSEIDDIFSGKI